MSKHHIDAEELGDGDFEIEENPKIAHIVDSDKIFCMEMIEDAYEKVFDALSCAYGLKWKNDENFIGTPKRIAKSLILERCKGINSRNDCFNLLQKAKFPSKYDGMVITSNPIITHSLCPHHMENVEYRVYMGYIPNGSVIGLSKFGRVIKLYSKQPILQEDYTKDLADIFDESLQSKGLIVVVYGQHNCMVARGLEAPANQWVITSAVKKEFETNSSIKDEFFKLINISKNYGN
jgi:GTP cyclohydrolase I